MAKAFDALVIAKLPLPLSVPENVVPAVLLLVMLLAALTDKVRALLKAVEPVTVRLPPPNTKLPEVAPKLPSEEIDKVPALMDVLPV